MVYEGYPVVSMETISSISVQARHEANTPSRLVEMKVKVDCV